MSLKDKINQNWENIIVKKQTLTEALGWSATGRNLKVAARDFAKSKAMEKTRAAVLSSEGNPIDRYKMAQYLALALECSPRENLSRFSDYLKDIAKKSDNKRRAEYYLKVRDAVQELRNSNELAIYMAVYSAFLQDDSESSTLARDVMSQIAHNTQRIIGVL